MTPTERAERRAEGKASYPYPMTHVCWCGVVIARYELLASLDPSTGVGETVRALVAAHRKTHAREYKGN